MHEFFGQLATRFRGHLRLAFLEADGQPAATMFQIEWAGRMNLYNSGFDPASRPKRSPTCLASSPATVFCWLTLIG